MNREKLSNLLKKVDWLFLLTVMLPTSLAIIYYGLLASDVYISESRFVIRSPEKPASSGLGMILKTAGFANAGDETQAAKFFIGSRDALAAINRNEEVSRSYASPSISIFDRFNPLGSSGSFEDLHKYFGDKVSADFDSGSTITTLSVRAYNPNDAQRFNRELLEQSEGLVNRLNQRGRKDLIEYAETEVREAQQQAGEAAARLAQYRNSTGVVDPQQQATVQLQMISKLQDQLIATRNQLAQLQASVPDNPQIPSLRTQIASLSAEIARGQGQVAGDRSSLSAKAARYERLVLDNDMASKRLGAAMTALQEARSEALHQQAYVERIAQPNLPDKALEPRRMRGIFAALALGLIAWGVLSMLLAGVREHRE
ncbi:capsular polysaccharide transport system permease [Novosphingobium sp. Rr 2-17]|uniref:sugar ABC transporter permease n=1 Tax=Novosphingobium sp. Rr 2-17 TaxID=555793 RepID=UPI0002697BD7|nr:sugar ABC transporter permease [Novosphingobium sp. Rr 2-17]EIZ77177.1 capsular polysaccharide transport system permease [Novosphingobium sp. Rr 2-17]